MKSLAIVVALLAAGPAHADLLATLTARPKPGLWAFTSQGRKQPQYFCMTEQERAGGLRRTVDSLRQLGCRPTKESSSGDDFEILLNCASPNPVLGRFEVRLAGTVRADSMRFRTEMSGGGAMLRQSRSAGMDAPDEWRWQRPCRAGEQPGLQVRP
jgi:hypothetical protein